MRALLDRLWQWKFVRYGFVGVLNVILSFAIFNFLLFTSDITKGIEVTFFSIITFAIVVTHSFFWNRYLVFKSSGTAHHEYAKFFTVSSSTAIINVGIISFLVNGVGAPEGISPTLWANIAVLLTIPVSVLGNFFGYLFLVFRRPPDILGHSSAHFIGIAGMGMSATAILLKEQGWEVGGSDLEVYPPATTQLERHGIPYKTSYDAKNIPNDADIIVIGKNAKLTREDNPEVEAAYASGISIQSFPEVLSDVLKGRETIVIAGSYGKSTTTALIAWILSRSDVDAGWFVGAAPEGMEPAHLGTNPVFVVEGDEYPTSHEDPRPKFAHYRAHDSLVIAATHDHVNIYKTHEDYLNGFKTLAKSLPKNGTLLLCADEPFARALGQYASARAVSYGLDKSAEWRAENIIHGETTTFDLMHGEECVVQLSTSLLGEHNVQNIVGAAAMLLEKKLVTPEQLSNALKDFRGLARRLDRKTTCSTVPAYEGFGSSREKLQAAIRALRDRHPEKRLVVVFEPHTFSWRNKNMLHWFDTAFEGASVVILYKPAEQGASTHEQSTQEEMTERLSATGIVVIALREPGEVLSSLKNNVRDGDVVLLSSSGPMDGLIEEIPKWLDNTFV